MVVIEGNMRMYRGVRVGLADAPSPPGQKILHLLFGEQDFDPETLDHMNTYHVFAIPDEGVEPLIEMIRTWQGKKNIQIATPGDMPNG